jgi:glutamate/aspartate transport system substrate-binding protein
MSLSIVKQAHKGCALLLCFAGVSISALAHANDTLARIRQTQTITIAHREASMPFSYVDENTKKPVGYAVDLCLKIADAVKRELKLPNLKIEFLPVTSSTRIPAIADGKADLECGSTTNNAERRKQVAFTIPHFIAATRMVVRANSGIKNWSDLHDKRVVTTKGTTTVKLLNDRDKARSLNLKLIEGVDHNESFMKVERGDAEAFAMDDVLLYGLRANSKNPSGFEIVGDPLSAEPYAIALRRDDPAFKSLVDREMARLIDDGELNRLYDKWFMRPIPPKNVNMKMPMSHLLRESLRFPTDKVAD